eukprot:scaffold36789_cov61-Phaeocystis_antarctica.AAC.2
MAATSGQSAVLVCGMCEKRCGNGSRPRWCRGRGSATALGNLNPGRGRGMSGLQSCQKALEREGQVFTEDEPSPHQAEL